MSKFLLLAAGCAALTVVAGCGSKSEPPSVAAVQSGGITARRSVKTASDADAAKISADPQDTTIEAIQSQTVPATLAGRVGPFETTTWRVKATIESVQLMKDGDYYMVLHGKKGGTTVVEVPDPATCKDSRFLSQIKEARKEIEDKYHPTTKQQKVHDDATVSGVGFLGWQGSSSKNKGKGAHGYSGARLLPGTGVDFGSK